jgi:hypothetical protein
MVEKTLNDLFYDNFEGHLFCRAANPENPAKAGKGREIGGTKICLLDPSR